MDIHMLRNLSNLKANLLPEVSSLLEDRVKTRAEIANDLLLHIQYLQMIEENMYKRITENRFSSNKAT